MVDQAADIAFFAVMAAVFPLLLSMTVRFVLTKDTVMVSDPDGANVTASVYPFISVIRPSIRTFLSSKTQRYTACITSMAACFRSRPVNSSYPNVVSTLIPCKGRINQWRT